MTRVVAALAAVAPTWRHTVHRATPAVVGALSVGWSTWLLGSHSVLAAGHSVLAAGLAIIRLLVMIVPGALLMAFVTPSKLGDDLGQRARWPARTR